MSKRAGICALVGLSFVALGCLPAGNYHSARTLGKGESSVGTTFSMQTWEFTDSSGDTTRITIPNLMPEITYHIGIQENLELGGRVMLGSPSKSATVIIFSVVGAVLLAIGAYVAINRSLSKTVLTGMTGLGAVVLILSGGNTAPSLISEWIP